MKVKFHNKTRTSPSIPLKLLKDAKWYLIPVYYFLSLSDLAREGFTHSGSYRFADHIYQAVPQGRYGAGKILDAVLLSLPSARSFRNRHFHTRDKVVEKLQELGHRELLNVLTVPSGIPRNLYEAAEILQNNYPSIHNKTVFHCLDLDKNLINTLQKEFKTKKMAHQFVFHRGDALKKKDYPTRLDIVVSTGLGEFLSDGTLLQFYKICYDTLRQGGYLITSATDEHKLSDYLMRNIGELYAFYRSENKIRQLLKKIPFSQIETFKDSVGLQTLIVAKK